MTFHVSLQAILLATVPGQCTSPKQQIIERISFIAHPHQYQHVNIVAFGRRRHQARDEGVLQHEIASDVILK